MNQTLIASVEVDAQNLVCPMPLLKARQAMNHLPENGLLHVTASDPGALRDIPAWLRQAGHQLVHQSEEDGVLHFWIRRQQEAKD